MTYHSFKATGPLKDYVKHFWVLEGKASAEKPYIHNYFADTCPELLFYFKGSFHELDNDHPAAIKTGIAGQSQKNRKLISTGDFGVFGVYLYPHAIKALFGIQAAELKDQMADLKSILGGDAGELEEKMMLAKDHAARLQIIRHFLEQKVRDLQQPVHPLITSIQQINTTNGMITLEELASHFSLSTRQFERNFLNFSGLNPKLFARIVRFQSALKKLNHPGKSMTKIAYETDYFDQAHFIRDFKLFTGMKPKEFVKYHQPNALWLSQ